MAFHDTRLPVEVERGAIGGPGFKTTVISLSSGFEKRNIDWANSRGAWDIGYGIQKKSDFEQVIAFFYTRQGRAHSFRFKDWSDFEILTAQSIGTGDGANTTFQVFKRYTNGVTTFDRTLTKLVSGTVRVFLDTVEKTITADFTVNLLTGIVTMNAAPGAGVDVTVITEFDVPVRFDTDKLDVNSSTFDAGAIPQIPIVEVRGE